MSNKNNNFIQKEKALIQAMAKDNYAIFDGDRDDALDFITSSLEKFTDYANVVIREQVMQPIWNERCSTEDANYHRQRIDAERRMKHNGAIDSLNTLNRLSVKMGLPLFADIDTNDRYAVADMVGDYVNEVYNQGIGKGMDGATYQKTMDYDTKAHTRELRNFVSPVTHHTVDTGMEL